MRDINKGDSVIVYCFPLLAKGVVKEVKFINDPLSLYVIELESGRTVRYTGSSIHEMDDVSISDLLAEMEEDMSLMSHMSEQVSMMVDES